MDDAVSAKPENLEIRFVPAVATYHLPGFFHRREQSKQDFACVARRAVNAARTGAFEPQLAAASLYFRGEFLKQAGEEHMAIASWRSVIDIAADSRAAQGARERLKELNH